MSGIYLWAAQRRRNIRRVNCYEQNGGDGKMCGWLGQGGYCCLRHEGFITGIQGDTMGQANAWRPSNAWLRMGFYPIGRKELCGILIMEETMKIICSLFPTDSRILSQDLITACLFPDSYISFPHVHWLSHLCQWQQTLSSGSKADALRNIFDVCRQLQHQLKTHWPKSPWGALNKYKFLDSAPDQVNQDRFWDPDYYLLHDE